MDFGTDYYRILGVSPEASAEEIKNAFRRQAKKFHPDFHPENRSSSEARMKEINAAYEVLKDPSKRREYDCRFSRKGESAKAHYEEWSRGSKRRAKPPPKPKSPKKKCGNDIFLHIRISLEAAFSGVCGKLSYKRKRRCPSCRGTGKIFGNPCSRCCGSGFFDEAHCVQKRIPPGVKNGGKLRSFGDGHEGKSKNCFGDLFIVVNIEPHNFFTIRGGDLHCSVRMVKPTKRTKIEIPMPDGKKLRVAVPANVRDESILRVPGQGMPIIYTGTRGDLFIEIRILKL